MGSWILGRQIKSWYRAVPPDEPPEGSRLWVPFEDVSQELVQFSFKSWCRVSRPALELFLAGAIGHDPVKQACQSEGFPISRHLDGDTERRIFLENIYARGVERVWNAAVDGSRAKLQENLGHPFSGFCCRHGIAALEGFSPNHYILLPERRHEGLHMIK